MAIKHLSKPDRAVAARNLREMVRLQLKGDKKGMAAMDAYLNGEGPKPETKPSK